MRRERFDPPAEMPRVREQPGVRRCHHPVRAAAWLVTRYEDAREVLGDATRFSSAGLPVLPVPGATTAGSSARGNLLMLDPPEHTRLRRLLTGEFTVDASAGSSRASPRSSTSTSTRWRPRARPPTWCPTSRCRSRRW